jgi:hypothetical protein
MFVLSILEDNFRIAPQVGHSLAQAPTPRRWAKRTPVYNLLIILHASYRRPYLSLNVFFALLCFAPLLRQDLAKPVEDAVIEAIEGAFVDKVVLGLGLVLTLYDLVAIEEGHIHHSDGGAHHRVTFRVVVFSPAPGELLVGEVTDMSA